MTIADASIRPNSIAIRHALRTVCDHLRKAAGDYDPGESSEERARRELVEDGLRETRERLQRAAHWFLFEALLCGSLQAHFSDAKEAKDVPGWAWANADRQAVVWFYGCIVMGALLPDEWQRWSGEAVFLDRGEFDSWLDRQDFVAPDSTQLPIAFDAADRPEPIKHYAPPVRPYVTLSQALSWIAFGVSFESERLIRGIDQLAFGPADETNKRLEDAVSQLATLALGGDIEITGRYIESDEADDSTALTQIVESIRFHDFAQFDIHRDALRYGVGLTWTKSESISHLLLSKRRESFRSVMVNRAALVRHFSIQNDVAIAKPIPAVERPFEWSDFNADSLPELQRLNDLAMRDEWWTWPEAIAWIGSRDFRNIATLRYWGGLWTRNGDSNPTVTIAAQADIANRFCEAPHHAKTELISAIERGAVDTAGRMALHGRSEPLDKGDWRGGTIVYEDGGAKLVSAKNPLVAWAFDIAVSRADLVNEFPASPTSDQSDLSIYAGGIAYVLDEELPSILARSTGSAEAECRVWLEGEFSADPNRLRSKAHFCEAALVKFAGRLSARGFNHRVWPNLAQVHERDRVGRKRKS